MDSPGPLVELAIELKSKADQEKLIHALLRLVQEDPTFRATADPETGQTVIKGMSEQHLHDILRSGGQGLARGEVRVRAGGERVEVVGGQRDEIASGVADRPING